MPIPQTIQKHHIDKVLSELNPEDVPLKRRTTDFVLVHEGTEYPPKYVICLAGKHDPATKRELEAWEFHGGWGNRNRKEYANAFLDALGFTIRKYGTKENPIQCEDELPDELTYPEGAVKRITVNAYERDPQARSKCIQIHGCSCIVCGFDFAARFGDLGKGYIHVHHLKPLSAIGKEYLVNPAKDLVPVCPNCHAMLHRDGLPLSIDRLKNKMHEIKKASTVDICIALKDIMKAD